MKKNYLFYIAIIFICGVLSASSAPFRNIPTYLFGVLALTLFAFLAFSLKRDRLFMVFFFLAIFFLGMTRYDVFNKINTRHIKNYTPYRQEKVLLQGEVASDPSVKTGPKAREAFTLRAFAIKKKDRWQGVDGFVLVNIYGEIKNPYHYGDIVVVEGFLKRPFFYQKRGNFDYRKYLANKRIYSVLKVKKDFFAQKICVEENFTAHTVRSLYSLRSKIDNHIKSFLKYPESSILAAILLGKREGIPIDIREAFARTGTLHILAISGLHVGIIYFSLALILKIFRVRRNVSVAIALLFLICYTVLTGARPSIVRAATMFSILALGELLRRKISIFNLIGLSAFLILMTNPNQIFDIGFILSYAAVLSIITISPAVYGIFSARAIRPQASLKHPKGREGKVRRYLLQSVSVSLAVWIGLLPLTAYYFGLISPIVVIANLVVVPLLFMVMASGILFVTLGVLAKALALVFSESAWFFLFITINSVKFLEHIPWSYFEIKPPALSAVICYYIILAILVNTRKVKKLAFSFLT